MSEKCFKQLPIGNEDFTYIIQNGGYYVDKTSYLKKVFSNISPVILFTRPRRFGKTLLMDMFKSFLRVFPNRLGLVKRITGEMLEKTFFK